FCSSPKKCPTRRRDAETTSVPGCPESAVTVVALRENPAPDVPVEYPRQSDRTCLVVPTMPTYRVQYTHVNLRTCARVPDKIDWQEYDREFLRSVHNEQ